MKTLMVSICCITYNHEKYIRECLDSFLMQKTNFSYEILIHDDASTDHTADIIREYEKQYPDVVKPIYQTENQYSKGRRIINTLYNYPRAQGKYIALCEGDDFWTDPLKLQMQFDFMEAHPDYSLCTHGFYHLDYFNKSYYPTKRHRNFPENGIEFAHQTALGTYLYSTQTMFFRRDSWLSIKDAFIRDTKDAPMGDTQLAFHLALTGNVHYIPRRMAVYRIFPQSVTKDKNGYSRTFAEKGTIFRLQMVKNSGYEKWYEEYHYMITHPKTFWERLPSKIYGLLTLRRWHEKIAIFFGKKKFQQYIAKKQSL